ncbi:hypothetical protein C8J57DRAFT_1242896 [Mycena rebaudengoi]|nr:hypothetical protein C8J57DRAFT_1242896 [Mycena rebaudengoi]
MTTPQETQRLFGPVNRPDFTTNVRHRAILRKSLELFSAEDLQAMFTRPIRLRVTMGSGENYTALGKINAHYKHNNRIVSEVTPSLSALERNALRAYCNAYDTYFMKQGNDYRVRNAHATRVLQAAEQTWHDWVVPYLAACGRPGRPDWALQPLPGFQKVLVAPAPAASATPILPAIATLHKRGGLPTTQPVSPVRTEAAPSYSTPARVAEGVAGPSRKRNFLGVIDISSDEEDEEDAPPPKKRRFMGYIDLTNCQETCSTY